MTCCTFVYSVINLIWNKQYVFFIYHTLNACIASGGSGPFLYPEYLCVTLKSGTAMITKSCSCSSPFFVVLSHSSVFSKGNVVVAVFFVALSVVSPWYCLFTSCHTWSRSGVRLKSLTTSMKNTYCLFQIKFITEYTNVQQVIITQILLKQFN